MVSSGVGGERLHGCRGLCRDPRKFAAEMVHRKVKGLEFPKMLSLGEAITGDLVALPGTPANIFSNPGTPAAQHQVDGTMTVAANPVHVQLAVGQAHGMPEIKKHVP